MTVVALPEPSLVVLVGASGSGKTTFAAKHFRSTEVVSSDRARALVADDEYHQRATAAAFEVVHLLVDKRLELGRLTVVDATNVQPEHRAPLVALAGRHGVPAIAIVLDVPETLALQRNRARTDRSVGPYLLKRQLAALGRSINALDREGFARVVVLHSAAEIDATTIERRRARAPKPPGPQETVVRTNR
jgi:predicted kinase